MGHMTVVQITAALVYRFINKLVHHMSHIVDTRPLTKFEGGLNLLHEADDDAVIGLWLEVTATAALAK